MFAPDFQRTFSLTAAQVSPAGWLHLHETSRLLQEVAAAHADSWGIGFEAMRDRGLVWVLNRLHLRWDTLPRWRQVLTLTTWVGEMKGPLSDRYFRLTGPDGLWLGAAATRWIALNRDTGLPARVSFPHLPVRPGAPTYGLSFDSLPVPTGLHPAATYALRFSDLDPVGHANNGAYLRWAVDSYPDDFLPAHRPVEARVHYLSSVQAGQSVDVLTAPAADGRFDHEIQVGGRCACRLQLRWQPGNA